MQVGRLQGGGAPRTPEDGEADATNHLPPGLFVEGDTRRVLEAGKVLALLLPRLLQAGLVK